MLCVICEDLFREAYSTEAFTKVPSFDNPFAHHRTYVTLQQSWQHKCAICYRLYKRLHMYWPSIEQEHVALPSPLIVVVAEVEPNSIADRGDMQVLFTFSRAVTNSEAYINAAIRVEVLSIFRLWPTHTSSWRELEASSTEINVATCINLIETWLRTCNESHEYCRRQLKPDGFRYPTRLLDLQTARDGYIKLIITKNQTLHQPYATLSHCWGKAKILQLTRATCDKMQNQILLADLPKTFTDAIELAATLKTRFVWIDSLCIIQDSTEDWNQEAAQMGEVYKNAHYNIGAAASENSMGGLFRSRNLEVLNPIPITIRQKEFMLVWNSFWYSGIDNSHLMQRGWVFQEHWLCSRMIHFSDEQVFWECCSGLACEIHPTILSQPEDVYTLFKDLDSELRAISARKNEDERRNYALQLWDNLVNRYSSTKLSFDKDKLVAISGIAKEIQGILQDRYIAGMWRRSLVSQLAWRSYRAQTPRTIGSAYHLQSKRPSGYIAPSWSWASVDGIMEMNGSVGRYEAWLPGEDEVCKVVDVHIEQVTADPTGQVSAGYIYLQGPVTEVSIKRSMNQYRIGTFSYVVDIHSPGTSDSTGQSKELVTMDVETEEDYWERQYYFIALHKIRTGFGRLVGLLLEPNGSAMTEFRRVGRLMCPPSPRVNVYLDVKVVSSLPLTAFDQTYGYTVRII